VSEERGCILNMQGASEHCLCHPEDLNKSCVGLEGKNIKHFHKVSIICFLQELKFLSTKTKIINHNTRFSSKNDLENSKKNLSFSQI
jgi:hypothetical protein